MMLLDTSSHPRCLVVEDQALIGMELEACLEEVGIEIAGPFPSCERALAWAQTETPDMALLDYRLKDGFCTEVVRALRQRGVPVVIYSGYPQAADMPEDLRDVPWIEKPGHRATLLDVLVSLVPRKPLVPQPDLVTGIPAGYPLRSQQRVARQNHAEPIDP